MSDAAPIDCHRRTEDPAETLTRRAPETQTGNAPEILKPHALPQLDGIRFIAAFLVLVAHSWDHAQDIDMPRLACFIEMLAGVGLSLFFVLSGFVIHYT
jgi:peptidoglycan/LPS O-acetylase OafA/YrhL